MKIESIDKLWRREIAHLPPNKRKSELEQLDNDYTYYVRSITIGEYMTDFSSHEGLQLGLTEVHAASISVTISSDGE